VRSVPRSQQPPKDVEHLASKAARVREKAAKSGGTPDAGALSSLIFGRQAGAIIKHRSQPLHQLMIIEIELDLKEATAVGDQQCAMGRPSIPREIAMP
jgi:hypothetical protein